MQVSKTAAQRVGVSELNSREVKRYQYLFQGLIYNALLLTLKQCMYYINYPMSC